MIYGIVLNAVTEPTFPFVIGNDQWKLCKVGHTQKDTTTGTGNRMEQVIKQILDKYKKKTSKIAKAAVLFVYPVGSADTADFRSTEKRIRETAGRPVKKEKAKEYDLPCPTEWVVTPQAFIYTIKNKINDDKHKGGERGANVKE